MATSNKAGRPPTEINDRKLKVFMRLKPTLDDTAAFFECSTETIKRHIRKTHNTDFVSFRDQNMAQTRHNLVRKAIAMALKGHPAMLIFCLKNLCGWQDKHEDGENVGGGGTTFTLNYNLDK